MNVKRTIGTVAISAFGVGIVTTAVVATIAADNQDDKVSFLTTVVTEPTPVTTSTVPDIRAAPEETIEFIEEVPEVVVTTTTKPPAPVFVAPRVEAPPVIEPEVTVPPTAPPTIEAPPTTLPACPEVTYDGDLNGEGPQWEGGQPPTYDCNGPGWTELP